MSCQEVEEEKRLVKAKREKQIVERLPTATVNTKHGYIHFSKLYVTKGLFQDQLHLMNDLLGCPDAWQGVVSTKQRVWSWDL